MHSISFPLIFFCLRSVNSNSDSQVNCSRHDMWTYNRGVWTTSLHSYSLCDNKNVSKPRKMSIFISFPLIFFANAQKLKFRQPRQLCNSFAPTPEVLSLLPATHLHCLITKMAKNQEKRAILLVFR